MKATVKSEIKKRGKKKETENKVRDVKGNKGNINNISLFSLSNS